MKIHFLCIKNIDIIYSSFSLESYQRISIKSIKTWMQMIFSILSFFFIKSSPFSFFDWNVTFAEMFVALTSLHVSPDSRIDSNESKIIELTVPRLVSLQLHFFYPLSFVIWSDNMIRTYWFSFTWHVQLSRWQINSIWNRLLSS